MLRSRIPLQWVKYPTPRSVSQRPARLLTPTALGKAQPRIFPPLPPVYAGTVYRALGIHTPAAEAVLATSSVLIVVAGFALLYKIFGQLGVSRPARLLALAFIAVVPLNFELETIDFRIWEGGLAVLLGLSYLYAILRLEQAPKIGLGATVAMAFAAAIILFISPAMGIAAYAASVLLLFDRTPPREWPRTILIAVLALVAVLTPWTLRNQAMLGYPVILRSNSGLELALANFPAAVSGVDQRRVFLDRLEQIHPFQSQSAFDAMKAAGGEIPYNKALGAETKAWIVANPGDFLILTVRHLRQYLFPPDWMWHVSRVENPGTRPRQALDGAITAAGLLGALAGLLFGTRRYRYAVLMLTLPILPYMVVQPVMRYRYLIFGMLVFFAFDLADRLWRRFRPRSRQLEIHKALDLTAAAGHRFEDQAGEHRQHCDDDQAGDEHGGRQARDHAGLQVGDE